jgi:hypothetical protein
MNSSNATWIKEIKTRRTVMILREIVVPTGTKMRG